jgi:hypothetical protein
VSERLTVLVGRHFQEGAMVERRDVIGGGLAAGVAALLGGEPAQAAQRSSASDDPDTARAVDALRTMLVHQHESPDVDQIRAQQRMFLKTSQKFPDFIDVGIDVWEHMHDWHVKNRQPLTIVRTNDGHYGMAFAVTTLILQPQQSGTYISWGYDVR